MGFNLGDMVSWHNRPYDPPHKGKIVAIVSLGQRARRAAEAAGYENYGMDFGYPRNEISYVVHEPSKSSKGKGKLFWPRVSVLKLEGKA